MKHARRLPLWALSLIVVVGLHIALYYAALLWRPAVTPIQLEAAAMLVELEPLAPPQPTPQQPVVEPEPEPIPEVVEAPEPALAIVKPKPQVKPRPQPPKPKVEPQAAPAPKAASQTQAAAPLRAPVQQQTSQGKIDRERALWMAKLQAYLSKRLHYPDRERRFNRPGSKHALLLSFTIDSRGRILASEVKQSTARSSFDRDVQRQLRQASPVPPPPKKVLASGSMSIDYPLNFTLTR